MLIIYNDLTDNNYDEKETKRALIHIANYCLFIFTKLNQ